MKKIILFIFFIPAQIILLKAQDFSQSDSGLIITLNQQIDNYVVLHNTAALDKLYAGDFVFSHGSGKAGLYR